MMRRVITGGMQAVALLWGALSVCACTGQGTCPPNGRMVNGGVCHGEDLQCPYNVAISLCDGSKSTFTSSCSCVKGAWVCPEAEAPTCTVLSGDASVSPVPTSSSGGGATSPFGTPPPPHSGSSCPFVYVWDGTSFQYETDLGGITIGLPEGITANRAIPLVNGGLFYQKLPHAKFDPQTGTQILIRETVREIAYLDQVRLVVADYPEGYEVWDTGEESTDEWGYVNPFKLFTSKNARAPLTAVNQTGLDVTQYLGTADNAPAPMGEKTLDSYELDFGPIQHPEYAKLLIDGWSVYGDLADIDIQPFVEAQDAQGIWTTIHKFGAPYGDFKTIVLDLSGKVTAGTRRLRVNLGMENGARWIIDRILFDDSAPAPVTTAYLDLAAANLTHRGRATLHRCTYLSRGEALNDENPDDPAQFGFGAFTRYGDVLPLLTQFDDQPVVMRHGDQITLQFPGLAAPAPGMIRALFLETDVTMKSFILGKNVEPMPFHGMSAYPYPSTESFPSDAEHLRYLNDYNTRVYPAP